MALARVPDGMASQSMAPNTAASRPDRIPPAMFQYATVAKATRPVARYTTSATTAMMNRPRGSTINIGWMGCPSSLALASMQFLPAWDEQRAGHERTAGRTEAGPWCERPRYRTDEQGRPRLGLSRTRSFA